VQPSAPLWLDEPYAARPALAGREAAQVCVIGGGIGGIATAWRLLDAGMRPIVLEAREVASGASGRNGGFFIAGAAPMYHEAVARWGRDHARALHAATLSAQREMLAVAEEVRARQHFRLEGMLRLAVDADEAADVREHQRALAADGFAGDLVAETDLPAVLRRPGRLGLHIPGDGAVHPARWVRALAAAAEARGARIFESTPARAPQADGASVRVATSAGVVACEHAVVAMDAGLATLVPGAAAVRSRRLNMVATAPEPRRLLPCPVYARHGLEYAQQLPDGRLAVGGFSDLDGDASWTDREELSEPVQSRLGAYLREEYGVRAAITHRWVGLVGYAEDPLPRCGEVPGSGGRVLALGGYNGTGHVQAWVAAGIVARLIARHEPADNIYGPIAAAP
jgi:gamma-glutamylputrescine oxidase